MFKDPFLLSILLYVLRLRLTLNRPQILVLFLTLWSFFGPFGNVQNMMKDSWWEGLDQISEKFSKMTDSVHIGEISGMHCLEQVNDHTGGLYTGTI